MTDYLKSHRELLHPELRDLWDANGSKATGTWTEVFGDSARADEIFMAWNYARYIQAVAAAGKAMYDIPMYVNVWLASDDSAPGSYPGGGAEPRVMDVWKAAGTAIDLYAPDLYASNFPDWCKRFHRAGNPLFIPETGGGPSAAANVFYAIGEQSALGFSPFGIDTNATAELAASYNTLKSLMPQITAHQAAGTIRGFTIDKAHPFVDLEMGGLMLHVTLNEIFGHADKAFGLIMTDGENRFIGAGKGFRVTFGTRSNKTSEMGISEIEEGAFLNGTWNSGRHLNGDESEQGANWVFDASEIQIQKIKLYRSVVR